MRVRRRSVPGAPLVLVAALSASEPAAGAEHWLSIEPSRRCTPERDGLASRIASVLAGARDPELSVHVELADDTAGTSARVRLSRGSRELGTKQLPAAGCEEALDTVVAVAALALGTPARSAGSSAGATPEHSTPSPRLSPSAPPATAGERPPSMQVVEARSAAGRGPPGLEDHDRPPSETDAGSTSDRWRWLWSAGLGRGALGPTPIARPGVGVELGRSELRASLQYGMPASNESVEAGVALERSRSDFAGAAFDYCRALDADRWLSACAVLEARLTRASRMEARDGRPRVERERFEPAGLAGASVSFAYAAATWRPRLDLSAHFPVAGEPFGGAAIGMTAAIGGSLPF